ncbi:MAG: Tn3 family transposase, partial [Nitrospirota bacterium]|nr:Tn3 family transposase [Nitrospirota bacterium]
LPVDRVELAKHYTLSEDELAIIHRRRRARNRLGFALQLCALRYPGRLLQPGELIPSSTLAFIAEQIDVDVEALMPYGIRENTRYEHSAALQEQLGYRPFAGRVRQHFRDWLEVQAVEARSGFELAGWFLAELHRRKVIAPGISVVERLCADALTRAERAIWSMLARNLDRDQARCLDELLELRDEGASWFTWLRRPAGQAHAGNFKDIVTRLEKLRASGIETERGDRVPRHQLERLHRESERISLAHLRGLSQLHRRAILVAAVLELVPKLTDAAMDMHGHIVGRMFKRAEHRQIEALQRHRKLINRTVRLYADIGSALIEARTTGDDPFVQIDKTIGWQRFEASVAEAHDLAGQNHEDTLELLGDDYNRLRRHAPLMLECFSFRGRTRMQPLLKALALLQELNTAGRRRVPDDAPIGFIKGRWRSLVMQHDGIDRRSYELCTMVELRNALRAGDVWVVGGRRYRALDDDLLPLSTPAVARVATELSYDAYIENRGRRLAEALHDVDRLAARGGLPGATIENGQLSVAALDNATPPIVEKLRDELYSLLPRIRITDLLEEVDRWTGFSESFTHLKTGLPVEDRRLLLTTVLADGTNLGLTRMAQACDAGSFWQLARTVDWHVREETYIRATACLVDAQRQLAIANRWGDGTSSSSDGQHFHVGGHGQTLAVVNARHGHEPGVNVYSHISDQCGPYYTKVIAATAHEAPHVLDGLLQHESSLQIETHHTDTGGFTDHVFGLCALLGVRFAPRLRDLPDRRIYRLDPTVTYSALEPIIGDDIKIRLIKEHWHDIIRLVASIRNGTVVPSHILQKLAAYPRQNGLAQALREIGRIERTLFILDWLRSPELRHQTQNNLNKGEERNALAKALFFYRLGRFRDRTYENQQYRAGGLNLLIAAIVLWNSTYLERAVVALRQADRQVSDELLAHVWPLAWDHINIIGNYNWSVATPDGFRPLRLDKMRTQPALRLAA